MSLTHRQYPRIGARIANLKRGILVMTKFFGSLVLLSTLVSTGCSQLNLKGGLSDFSADSGAGQDEASSLSAGVGFESTLNRRWSVETGFWWDGEIVDGPGSGSIEQISVDVDVDFNLIPDGRGSDHFFLPVNSTDHGDDEDGPWILSPLAWWEENFPTLVPFIRAGVSWANQTVDTGTDDDTFDDFFFKGGGGFKWNISDQDQIRFGAEYVSLHSTESDLAKGSLLRYFVGYSISF